MREVFKDRGKVVTLPDLAWEFLEMAWPPNIPEKDEWASDFRATLEESQFWPLDGKRAYFVP